MKVTRFGKRRMALTVALAVLGVVVTSLAVTQGSHVRSLGSQTVVQVPTSCDGSGDSQPADDCVRQSLPSATGQLKVAGGASYPIKVTTHPGLRGSVMIAQVEYRSIGVGGAVGSWWGHRRVQLASLNQSPDIHNIRACAPTTPGRYQVRTALWVQVPRTKGSIHSRTSAWRGSLHGESNAKLADVMLAGQEPVPPAVGQDVVTSATSTITATAGSTSCQNSPDDDMLVEYFNQIDFNGAISIAANDTGSAFDLQITCPTPITPTVPGPDFSLALIAADGSAGTSCSSAAPISISKSSLATAPYCTAGGQCDFMVILSNSSTGTIYSVTEIRYTFVAGATTSSSAIIPQLQPATVPPCESPPKICAASGLCSLSPTTIGVLSLCQNAASCTVPVNSDYSLNSNVYFELNIVDKITNV
jgi:hypothetical protein